MLKSLMYLIAILVSFIFLLAGGVIFGALLFYFSGTFINSLIADSQYEFYRSWSGPLTLTGAICGGVASLCWWFKTVGYIVELENVSLIKNVSFSKESGFADASGQQATISPDAPFIGARDAQLGNHIMVGGIVVFLSSVVYFSQTSYITGFIGIASMTAGLFISLAAYEFPSESGIWRKIKLLLRNKRP